MKNHSSSYPVSSMPGSQHKVEPNTTCDTHENIPAVKKVQGETDSMGCEFIYKCQECLDKFKLIPSEFEGTCSWCKSQSTTLRHHRDFEEGMSGPMYNVCKECRDKESKALHEELEEMKYGDYDLYFDDFIDDEDIIER